MTYPVRRRSIVLFRASRETVVLLASATAFTLVLAHAAHRRPEPAPAGPQVVQQGWTGQLADVAIDAPRASEPLTSASLVVPSAALPAPVVVPASGTTPPAANVAAARQPASAKARSCDLPSCAPIKLGPQPVATPALKQVASAEPARPRSEDGAGLIGKLNPLKHLPDAVRHPFDYAGDAVSSWIRRL